MASGICFFRRAFTATGNFNKKTTLVQGPVLNLRIRRPRIAKECATQLRALTDAQLATDPLLLRQRNELNVSLEVFSVGGRRL